jgi:uncharacterized membrane protein YheB (UPF0754 family)
MNDLVLLFLTVPLITAFVGWVTNWAAVKMIFHPEEFVGIGPIGWQGILQRRSHKFATGIADMATENLLSPRELAEKLDPEEMEKLFAQTLDQQTDSMVDEAAEIIRPGAWKEMPPHVKQMVIMQVKSQTNQITREVFDKLQGVSDELLDLHHLVYSQLSGKNVALLAKFTKEIGAKEFKFIEYYGGVFGLIIGLAQVGVWSLMQTWWLMPIVGIAVGLVTNWLAIQMIFRPQETTRYLGLFKYQGLFPKRQAQISADYGRVSAADILTPRNLIRLVSEGQAGERIAKIVTETISEKIDTEWKKVAPMVPVEVTPEHLELVKARIVDRIAATVPDVQPEFEAYLERKLDIAETIESKLSGLPKSEFERILRGVFEEDEITLIIVGGFLGGAVGVAQGMLVLGLGL